MMIPRDIINRRKNIYLTLVAIGFAVMAILAFIEKYMTHALFNALLYSSLSLFVVGNILIYIGIRCPKCDALIGYVIVFSAEKVVQCPRCRINFDESIL